MNLLPIAKPYCGAEEIAAAAEAIRSGWISQGPKVAEFERAFAQAVGAPHACAVANGTAALHLALLAVGVKPGDEVITVSHSFIATANAIRYCGAKPVFVDIQPETYNLDPAELDAAISPRTRAILCVHQMGMPCDLPAILALAGRHGLKVIEDAACATGSTIRIGDDWQPIGRPHGDIACFSFHPRKVLTTGEGGMLTTRDAALDQKFRLLRQHAMGVSDSARHHSPQVVFEDYRELGFNLRLTDIQAAIGLEQLKRLPSLVARRRALADRYRGLLAEIPGLGLPVEPDWARSNWQSFCVRLPEGVDQHRVMQTMLDRGIATRRGIMCAHREAAYPPETWASTRALWKSEEAQDRGVILPLFHELGFEEQNRVVGQLAEALRGA